MVIYFSLSLNTPQLFIFSNFIYMSILVTSLFPMRILLLSSFFLIYYSANCYCMDAALVFGQCQSNQQSLLLQIKDSLIFNSTLSVNLVQWSESTDCCTWNGVDCDGAGHVINLRLSNESISGGIENATGLFSLKYLQSLNLAFNSFNATLIPSRLANLTNLIYLNLSNAGFTGQIPGTISGMTRMVTLDFSSNSLNGPIPTFRMSRNLSYLDLSHNSLSGSIPPSLFALPLLQKLQLANNKFEGEIPELSNASSSLLDTLDLSGNRLEGPIPMSIFELKKLRNLLLSSNKFNGTIQLGMFKKLGNLAELDLSYNSLAIHATTNSSYFLSHISSLRLASCKLSVIPSLKNQSKLFHLDLSDNQISGDIPKWIWEVGNGGLTHLNLSHNLLVGMEMPHYSTPGLILLDLHSNQLEGKFLHRPPTAVYMDYSSNKFISSIPADIGNFLSSTIFFSLSNNSLSGVIPESICDARKLQVLDFSSNYLSGSVPTCLIERSETLGVLSLRGNRLEGAISDAFPKDCGLQTLDLNGNQLTGRVPKSLINCSNLAVFDFGNNQFYDTFPCWLLGNLRGLRVLVLRSNNFYGRIECPEVTDIWSLLQIVDLASNNFSGLIPGYEAKYWGKMMMDENEGQSNPKQLRYEFRGFYQLYYQDSVTVTSKGQKMELVKILTLFTSIDFSCNNFEGSIPEEIGLFKAVRVANLSHNAITGPIPSSIGNLRQLESLDVSFNKLSGKIPAEVANLTFLAFCNVSYNHLVGRIPLSTQLQSFPASFFEGNEGLCGPPLVKQCTDSSILLPNNSAPAGLSNKIDREFMVQAIGFAIGFGAVVASLLFCEKVNKWYDDCIKKFLR